MDNILFFDSTLRDGSHAVSHQISAESISQYCHEADNVGLHTIIVGHGNGLGASSLQVGLSALSDEEMLNTARLELKKTKLGVFLIPGFGTIKENLAPALKIGVDLVCVGTHCTEADVTRQHIEYVRNNGKEAYGVLMMYHMTTTERLLEEAKKMQDYGALGVILMDSAGASTPDMVSEKVKYLVDNLDVKVGFHAHNNLSLAVANSYTAIKEGATIVDGTLRGFGAGAGNCQLEVLAGLLQKLDIETGLNLYKMMDISEYIVTKIMKKPQEITSLSLISGLAGVFSAFAKHVQKASERFKVDPRDIFIELGKRKIIGGQEDFIVDVAMNLAQRKKQDDISYQLESLL
ncbi:4-hydroxy-2-oxovalerate aldolase [Clostridium sp.]|jgi:4-hydroxy 2-oxovalerate aldolase|uniref:4-hydroxy-2-oxovalerate aldolase n=1 Tax=Clostridium sp. TaxID=1506 RepID=UPI003EEB3734